MCELRKDAALRKAGIRHHLGDEILFVQPVHVARDLAVEPAARQVFEHKGQKLRQQDRSGEIAARIGPNTECQQHDKRKAGRERREYNGRQPV